VAGKLDLTIEQGVTWVREIIWKDSSRVPIDVSGYSAAMQIRNPLDDTIPLLSITNIGAINVGTTDGKFVITLTAVTTAALDFDTAVYDLKVISPAPANTVTRLIEGTVTLDKAVTR
jgi:hypothetical protein